MSIETNPLLQSAWEPPALRLYPLTLDYRFTNKWTTFGALSRGFATYRASLLSDEHFARFCSELNLDQNSSKVRNLIKIGTKFARLSKHTDSLPPFLSSLSLVADLPGDDLDQMVGDHKIHEGSTWRQVLAIVRSKPGYTNGGAQ